METKFERVTPNLLVGVFENETDGICFGMNPSDRIAHFDGIARIVRNNIGNLKVQPARLEAQRAVMENRFSGVRTIKPEELLYTGNIEDYMHVLRQNNGRIVVRSIPLLDGAYVSLQAGTLENQYLVHDYLRSGEALQSIKDGMDHFEKKFGVKLDRSATEQAFRREYEVLKQKLPDCSAGLQVLEFDVNVPATRRSTTQDSGIIGLTRLKPEGQDIIKATRDELIAFLREFDGLPLSEEAPHLHCDIDELYSRSNTLVSRYRGILDNPGSKMFQL